MKHLSVNGVMTSRSVLPMYSYPYGRLADNIMTHMSPSTPLPSSAASGSSMAADRCSVQ